MIQSLLVANRGEIACRIFRTARRLGIRAIAVFSDADASARHVREADEAVHIGPAAPRESYLNVSRLLDAARVAGAEAIHPGYGFLSENASFARACVEAGLRFVGPPSEAIAAMGSKIVAKARMRAAGVPVLPGYEGSSQELSHLETEALRLGLPLIIKPAAGGGGKGMRIVREASDLPAGLAAARRLAESAFGDGALLLERYLPSPRHVEVQIFADAHGNLVHLGDRDCSLQRRHQKVIEEAPAPQLPDDVRMRLREAALIVAREIGYVSAGTVEFLFDGREFYFMEMNTRLQVEHTVTEAVTGLDLVEWQLRVASGERLPLQQAAIRLEGHAIEARVCAEDPDRDFLPSAGRLQLMRWPSGEHVRVDAGFSSGDRVPESYDSLLGKVIAWAPSRGEAARRLAGALQQTLCAGVHSNEQWLARLVRTPEFLEVRHSIAFLQERGGRLRGAADSSGDIESHGAVLALAAVLAHCDRVAPPASNPWQARDAFCPNLPATVDLELSAQGHDIRSSIEFAGGVPTAVTLRSGRKAHRLALESLRFGADPDSGLGTGVEGGVEAGVGRVTASVGGRPLRASYFRGGGHIHLWLDHEHFECVLKDPRAAEYTVAASAGGLTTPLPGVVVAVAVQNGQQVRAGEVLMVIEAMKMEHTITAPYAGTVEAVHFSRGARVPEGSALLELTPEESVKKP